MNLRADYANLEIRESADGVLSLALKPTISLAVAITRSALLLAISLAFALTAIVLPIASLILFVHGSFQKLARRITLKLRRQGIGGNWN